MSERGTADAAFLHEACVYRSAGEFLATTLPFVRDGLRLGEPVLAVTTPANIELIGRALGPEADRVEFVDAHSWYGTPLATLSAYDRYVARWTEPAGHVRVIGEPVWSSRTDRQVIDLQRYESVLNVVFASSPAWIVCPYDTRVLDPAVVIGARRTHPALATSRGRVPSSEFLAPEAFFLACDDTAPLSDAPPDAAVLPFAGDLGGVRRFATTQAVLHGVAGEPAVLFAAAAGEAVAYVADRGGDRAVVRMWANRGEIVLEVLNAAGHLPDPFPGYRPPSLLRSQPDDGLWFTRHVCEFVEIRSGEFGAVARLHFPRPLVGHPADVNPGTPVPGLRRTH
ncbi:MEDS domain-containing protein [Allokutzneria albata]|uniref:MEDS: MEthanogen/methylotroph, DcmR Sensory domain n=1 Tax=Allokutzneria albata TaxID=211114 RepID=A0A1H0CH58_ALLAB|nr:MEDS domain-containing protein [Allokutzneria albata]SDN57153.1 MEDS: MEthanogen/methylotroph, DcmR Sensory domain [Allokutzneria albata]